MNEGEKIKTERFVITQNKCRFSDPPTSLFELKQMGIILHETDY